MNKTIAVVSFCILATVLCLSALTAEVYMTMEGHERGLSESLTLLLSNLAMAFAGYSSGLMKGGRQNGNGSGASK